MNIPGVRLLVPLALLGGMAGASAVFPPAACQIGPVSSSVMTYQVPTGARGTLNFRVRCPAGQTYVVRLSTPEGPLLGANAALRFLGAGQSEAVMSLTDLPADLTVSGERDFSLSLRAEPGQWKLVGGTYRTNLEIGTEPLAPPL
ncbi:hypothetical protein [Deinococcus gobiensis]|uniref:Lipoprotein n=1 Tax=Deinococcus gobiensis (strain DSM 21396 / JCM 16679 / CGMCC 1.7299 / I-0) TaxID=745776 RepID=H8GX70_DEIGI|nr:hypothetical protein [Deinococcus gobiensis]AFD24610.1 hypothetical protein DGo_CA0683 [Deinococcus gobiensis I-0]